MRALLVVLPLALIVLVSPVGAQQADAPDCPSPPVLPAELAGWPARAPLAAAADRDGLATAVLAVGQAVDAALVATPRVRFVVFPERPGGSVSYGGMFAFDAPEAGRYRVALASAAWVDVIERGQAVESMAHGRGPACSTIRKVVTFALDPGRHVLQVSGNADSTLAILVTRVP